MNVLKFVTLENLGVFLSNIKDWVEAKKYLTEHQSLADYAKKSEIPSDFYSQSEVDSKISAAKSEIIGGAGQDYDTLKEIETWIGTHGNLYDALVATVGQKAATDYVNTELAKKADKSDTYTKEEVDGLIEDVDVTEQLEDYAKKAEVTAEIRTKVESLDATVGSTEVADSKHVAVEVVEEDGKLTALTVTENDIASASELASLKGLVGTTSVASQISSAVEAAKSELNDSIEDACKVEDVVYGSESLVVGKKVNLQNVFVACTEGEINDLFSA